MWELFSFIQFLHPQIWRKLRVWFLVHNPFMVLVSIFLSAQTQTKEPPFYQDIQKFVISDKKNPPKKGQILFVGSSSFTKWTDVATYFPKHHILNRGFGGSTLADIIRYQDQIIYPYRPSEIVIYCGENDVAASDKPDAYVVYRRFIELYTDIRNHLPKIPVVFVSLKPSPSRWALRAKMIAVNGWIRELSLGDPQLTFVDVWEAMLDKDRRPMGDIFLEDQLHMNSKGYKIWQKLIEPNLVNSP